MTRRIEKTTVKPRAPKTIRKKSVGKNKVECSCRLNTGHMTVWTCPVHGEILNVLSWRPRAKSKEEKHALALRSHKRRERSTNPCAIPLCPKLALLNDTLCSKHAGARDNVPTVEAV